MKRAVRNVICLLAGGLIVFGGLEVGLEFVKHRLHDGETNVWQYVIGSLLIILGTILFGVSGKVAGRLTGEDDDDISLPPPEH
jgi:cytochrome c biogenesis protein CcdA